MAASPSSTTLEQWQAPPGRRSRPLRTGALSRAQALAAGISSSTWDRNLRRQLWTTLFPGVAATFSGPVPERTRVWAAVLYAGEGARASHGTAAALDGLFDRPPAAVQVMVPEPRRVRRQPGLVVHRSRRLARNRDPVRTPPRTRLEDTVLDLVDSASRAEQVIDVVLRACQRRLTTALRLSRAAGQRTTLRWRGLFDELLVDVREGVASPLERRWRRDVERAHGLRPGVRNRTEGSSSARRYRDVRYPEWHLVVELDGSAAHPPESAHLDRARDRELVEVGVDTLRFGWPEVAGQPCASAAQFGRVLARRGWPAVLHACGNHCTAITQMRKLASA